MSETIHKALLAAGWRYDIKRDHYAAPGSPTDGSARLFDQAAAWQAQMRGVAQPPADPRARHTGDDRRQEPE